MTLKEYLASYGVKQRHVAQVAGLSIWRLHRYVNGLADPDLLSIAAIERATEGRVRADDWVRAAVQRAGAAE